MKRYETKQNIIMKGKVMSGRRGELKRRARGRKYGDWGQKKDVTKKHSFKNIKKKEKRKENERKRERTLCAVAVGKVILFRKRNLIEKKKKLTE